MKKKRLILLLVMVLICQTSLFAKVNSSYNLGQLENGAIKLVYGVNTINTYKAYGTHYIAIADLQLLGCNVTYTAGTKTVSVTAPSTAPTTTSAALSVNLGSINLYDGTVQIGHLQSQSISCDGRTFVPLAALGEFGTLSITDDICTFTPVSEPPVVATQTAVKNFSGEPLQISVLDIYWKNEALLETASYSVNPNEILSRTATVEDKDAMYITTVIQSVQGSTINYSNSSYLGQLNTPLLEAYSKAEKLASTAAKVTGDALTSDKAAWAESVVNSKSLSSPTPYLVWTHIEEQRTYIFEGSTNNWKLYKSFICSTGRDYTPTPKGTFALTYKVPSFGQNKGYCCKYAFGFIGTTYLYHSIIFDKTGTYLLENKGVLGNKASQGCIRFSVENAKWFYDNMISGTTVYIS